jgi:phosphatidylserine/phosphatidylglycerophosphate/cardiolipin synthase-like enzyme
MQSVIHKVAERRVSVRVLVDAKHQLTDTTFGPLRETPHLQVKYTSYTLHSKLLIIDCQTPQVQMLSGSTNPTPFSEQSIEHVLFFVKEDERVIQETVEDFDRLWQESECFQRKKYDIQQEIQEMFDLHWQEPVCAETIWQKHPKP